MSTQIVRTRGRLLTGTIRRPSSFWRRLGARDDVRPRLTVSIQTRNSAQHLREVIADAATYADEVLVGVDVASSDATFQFASAHADVTYQYHLSGELAPARMLPLDYASGDWILSLDDDEMMEPTLIEILGDLLNDPRATHYWFPRKWMVSVAPPECVDEAPWWPNYALRLFRNDRRLVWKPPGVHTGYQVQGQGYFETRTSILHFEPLWCSPERKRQKLELYRSWGSGGEAEEYYSVPERAHRRPVALRDRPPSRSAPPRRRIYPGVREPLPIGLPPWRAEFLDMRASETVMANQLLVGEARLRNTGGLSWHPPAASAGRWPTLNLSYRVLDSGGSRVAEGARCPVPRIVDPDEEVLMVGTFLAPATPGTYLLEWDLVSELECWFADCGSRTVKTSLDVLSPDAPIVSDSVGATAEL